MKPLNERVLNVQSQPIKHQKVNLEALQKLNPSLSGKQGWYKSRCSQKSLAPLAPSNTKRNPCCGCEKVHGKKSRVEWLNMSLHSQMAKRLG